MTICLMVSILATSDCPPLYLVNPTHPSHIFPKKFPIQMQLISTLSGPLRPRAPWGKGFSAAISVLPAWTQEHTVGALYLIPEWEAPTETISSGNGKHGPQYREEVWEDIMCTRDS